MARPTVEETLSGTVVDIRDIEAYCLDYKNLWLDTYDGLDKDTKFGSLVLVDALDAPEDVWDFASDDINTGSTVKTFPTASGDLFISSDSASDTDVDVLVDYIDSDGAAAQITPNTNGTTPVDLGVNGFDVNRAQISGATAAVGNLYLTTANNHTLGVPDDNAEVLAFIRAGHGQTQQSLYTVPLGKLLRMKTVYMPLARASGADGSAELNLRVREFGGTWIVKRRWFPTSSSPVNKPEFLSVPARASIALRAVDISDGDTNLTGEWLYTLEDA